MKLFSNIRIAYLEDVIEDWNKNIVAENAQWNWNDGNNTLTIYMENPRDLNNAEKEAWMNFGNALVSPLRFFSVGDTMVHDDVRSAEALDGVLWNIVDTLKTNTKFISADSDFVEDNDILDLREENPDMGLAKGVINFSFRSSYEKS